MRSVGRQLNVQVIALFQINVVVSDETTINSIQSEVRADTQAEIEKYVKSKFLSFFLLTEYEPE